MRFLLDTNTCIKHLNGQSEKIRDNLRIHAPQDIFLCSVVKAELFYGALKSQRPDRNLSRIAKFLDHFISLPFDDEAANHYGKIRSNLERSGKPIGPNVLLVASIALANDLVVVTHNTGEFSRVENLLIEDWE